MRFLSEVLKPIVKTEFQLLYVDHLVGPFLQRFQQERTPCMLEIGVAFHEMLQTVDQHSQHLSFMDPICDFFYHIKYMFTRDSLKGQMEVIMTLRPATRRTYHPQQQDGACSRQRSPALLLCPHSPPRATPAPPTSPCL
ncbi:mediator of RNA polymerase II transcription subunit 23-like [Salvelinus alpinus]